MRAIIGVAMLLSVVPALAGAAVEEPFAWRWVYAPCNFQVDDRVDELIQLMGRAKDAGYNGMVISDYKFGRLQGRPDNYYANLARTRGAAERLGEAAEPLGMELIPAVMPVGWSGSILQNDPDLAAALPVVDCDFIVRGGRSAVANEGDMLPLGDFEAATRPDDGWDWVDGPGKSTFLDSLEKHSGSRSLRMEEFKAGNEAGNCRLSVKLDLLPWHQYHVRLWIKTEDVRPAGDVRVLVLSDEGRSLNHTNLRVKANQPWTEHHIVFNTLQHGRVAFYVGIWGGQAGTIRLDDISVTETAGVNLLRRDGCPVRVTSADGATEYVEGQDFETWEFPMMGRDPWPGSYKVYHAPPPIELTQVSRIRDGERLKVSFYHALIIYDGQVACCLSSDEVFGHLEEQVRQIEEHLRPRIYFMSHDEIRVAGHCALCRATGLTPGGLLARNVKRCTEIIRRINPDAQVLVWSDMFDPHHNARDDYYLVAGTFEGSWEGLDPSVAVVNWNGGKAEQSLAFFAGRGHGQVIAGYYDDPDVEKHLYRWLDAAAEVERIRGIMYTTWRNDYSNLERFGEALRSYGASQR